jgi:hypothetical protein
MTREDCHYKANIVVSRDIQLADRITVLQGCEATSLEQRILRYRWPRASHLRKSLRDKVLTGMAITHEFVRYARRRAWIGSSALLKVSSVYTTSSMSMEHGRALRRSSPVVPSSVPDKGVFCGSVRIR